MIDALSILRNYPYKAPVIVISHNNIINLKKHKFIVDREYSIAYFHRVLCDYIPKNENEGVIMFVNNILPMHSELLGTIYDYHKSSDDFLYIHVTKENTFG